MPLALPPALRYLESSLYSRCFCHGCFGACGLWLAFPALRPLRSSLLSVLVSHSFPVWMAFCRMELPRLFGYLLAGEYVAGQFLFFILYYGYSFLLCCSG